MATQMTLHFMIFALQTRKISPGDHLGRCPIVTWTSAHWAPTQVTWPAPVQLISLIENLNNLLCNCSATMVEASRTTENRNLHGSKYLHGSQIG